METEEDGPQETVRFPCRTLLLVSFIIFVFGMGAESYLVGSYTLFMQFDTQFAGLFP
jgi:hypothetical protein